MIEWNIATGNPDKLREFRQMLEERYPSGIKLFSLEDYPELPEPVEDGDTLEANALIKARALFEHSGKPSIADDTGLMVDALNGEPGVYSARWAGPDCSYRDNVEKMIRLIRPVPPEKRQARFETVIAFVGPNGEHTLRGQCEGIILDEARGAGGFGYDPVFYLPGLDRSFAELSPAEKSRVSHRGRAMRAFMDWLAESGGTVNRA
jgi:XTP/dITP diphosphohydrolase